MEKKVEKKEVKKAEKQSKKPAKLDWNKIGLAVLSVAWVGIACIASQYIIGYPMLWILGEIEVQKPVWVMVYSALVYILAAVLITVVPKLIKKEWKISREELGLKELPTFTDIGIGIIGLIATLFIAGIAVTILQSLHLIVADQPQDTGFSNLYEPFDRIVAFLALVVFAPIAEEIIFRGWLFNKTKKHVGVGVAIALVSILFGAMHGQWNVGITVGIMSIIMCLEREITGTIYAGMITHMLKNGIAFYLLYVVAGV